MFYTLERQISIILLAAIVILAGIGIYAYYSNQATRSAVNWEKHTQDVIQQLDETIIAVIDSESSVRGFVILGREEYLEPYNQAKPNALQKLAQLKKLVADNPEQSARAAAFETQTREKFDYLELSVVLRRNGGLGAVVNTTGATNRDKDLMDKLRRTADEIKSAEVSLLEQRGRDLDESLNRTLFILIASIVIGMFMLALAEYVVLREIEKRQSAENELKETNRDLEKRVAERARQLSDSELLSRSILNSLSAHIAVLDKDGKIIAVNDPWENFARMNAGTVEQIKLTGIGQNYMAVCGVDTETEDSIPQKLRSVLGGRLDSFSIEYPCHSPDAERWFLMQVNSLLGEKGGAVVSHLDITARKKAETEREELLLRSQAARREAEIANRLRDEFMATVSHELRTPLNAILGWAKLLKQNKLNDEMRGKAIETIIRSSEAQNRLIEDLMDVAKIVSGKLQLDKIDVSPDNLVANAVETIKPSADAKAIKVNLNLDENQNGKKISGDPNRLQQVVWNLLTNAIKFTPEGGHIDVDLKTVDGFTEIKIKDSGVGIKPEFLPYVFERFRQDASNIKRSGGLGLGLAIVRHLTEMHGGEVSADSEGENKGSIFTVKLPVKKEIKDEG